MKKLLLITLLLFSYIYSYSQINLEDSTVQVISYWDKNEVQNYKIINKKTKYNNDVIISSDSTINYVEVTVLDSTQNSYTIQWLYRDYKVNNDEISQMLSNLPGNTKVIYKTNELGVFQEVVNWEEIRDEMNQSIEGVIKEMKEGNNMDDENIEKAIKQITATFSTKEAIESIVVTDIQQFHSFHGAIYPIGETLEYETQLPNILGPKPFSANLYVTLEEIYPDNNSYLISSQTVISKDQLLAATIEYLAKTAESVGKQLDSALFENMELESEVIAYSEIHETGWILYSTLTKIVKSGSSTMVDECSIEIF